MTLSALQFSILLALLRYRFLVCSQLHLMELSSLSAIRRALRMLTRIEQPSKLVQRLTFAPSARFGKLEHMYAITPYGLIFLQEHVPDFVALKSLKPVWNMFRLDYQHRRETVSFRIRLEKALRLQQQFELVSYANYFEKAEEVFAETGSTARKSATEVGFRNGRRVIPDSIFVLSDFQNRGLFVLEIELTKKVPRIFQKVRLHMALLSEGRLSHQYGLEGCDYRLLLVLEHNQVLKKVLADLEQSTSFRAFQRHMLFTTVAETARDVLRCWWQVGTLKYRVHLITGRPVSK